MRPVLAHLAALGRRHGASRGPLCGDFTIRCAAGSPDTIIGRSAVVYPPVDTGVLPARARPAASRLPGRVGAGALQAGRGRHRRPAAWPGVPLKVVGTGPELARLREHARARTSSSWAGASDEDVRTLYRTAPGGAAARRRGLRHRARWKPWPAGPRSSRWRPAAPSRPCVDGTTGRLVASPDAARLRRGAAGRCRRVSMRDVLRAHAERFSSDRFATALLEAADDLLSGPGARPPDGEALQPPARRLLRRRATPCSGMAAFVLAYLLRFESGLIAAPKGYPPFGQYVACCRSSACWCRSPFHLQGIYRLRRGRTRVDDFFAVLVGSILAVVLGVVSTLYFQAYYVPDELKDRGVLRGVAAGLGHVPRAQRRCSPTARGPSCARPSSGAGGAASASSGC